MNILLIQEPPLALVQREWFFAGFRIYVASGPNPLTAIIVHVSLLSRLVDLEGDRVCEAVVTAQLGNLWVSQLTFSTSRALAWTNSRVGWNSPLRHRTYDLWTWTPMGIRPYGVPI